MLDPDAYPGLLEALSNSGERRYQVQAFYDNELTLDDVPVDPEGGGSLDSLDVAAVQETATLYVARDTGTAGSLVPQEMTDPLAPFGQELAINYVVRSGEQEWTVPLGRFGIAKVPSMRDYWARFPSRSASVGYELILKLRDRFDVIRSSDFLYPTAPLPGSTSWAEIRRLSSFPVVENVADANVPAALAYADSRLDALTALFANLGTDPALTRQGSLTARLRSPWLTETVPVFELDDSVIRMSDEMSSDGLYNAVRVRSVAGENTIIAVAQLEALGNPLRVDGPFGVRTYGYSSPLITTQEAAEAAAATILERVSTRRAKTVTVECLPNPLIELGDYGTATDQDSGVTVTGAVTQISRPLNPWASMRLELTTSTVGTV